MLDETTPVEIMTSLHEMRTAASYADWCVLLTEHPEDDGHVEVFLIGQSDEDAIRLLRFAADRLEGKHGPTAPTERE